MKPHGSTTVEAVMIFPLVFIYCMVFLQIALYFAAVEYAECAGNAGILMGEDTELSEGEISQKVSGILQAGALFDTDSHVQAGSERLAGLPGIRIAIQGEYRLLYPMQVNVVSQGCCLRADHFIRNVDLIWETAGRLKGAGDLVKRWFGK